jgi:hypothetical protein
MRKPENRGKRFPLKTPNQRLALDLFAKALKGGKPFTITHVLMQAGYSEESVRQFTNVMESLAPHLDPIVQRLETHRDKILSKMETKVDQASYGELVRALDVTTKSARLLGGKSTSNLAVIHGERRRELDALIDDNQTDEGED